MRHMKKLILLLVGGVTLAGFSACARNFHNGNISQDESFKLMGFQDSGTPNFDKMHGRMESFMKDLNLTDAQKETFKEIKNAVKENFEKNKDKRIALRESLKKEFLSDSINKENLKSSIDTMKSEHEAKVDMMANNIIKIYKTLTPEQRTKIENKMKFIEDKVSMFADKPFFKNFHNGSEKRLAFLKSNLHLSEDQVNSLKGLFEGNKDQKSEMFKNFKSIKDSVQTELKTGNPDVEKIKGILNDGRKIMESKMDSHLDKIVKVHDVLNPEQRQKLVTLLETKHKSMFDKMKSHF